MNRRIFLRTTAATGAGFAVGSVAFGQAQITAKPDVINLGLIGLGARGFALSSAIATRLRRYGDESIRFKAVCDIKSRSRTQASRMLNVYKHKYPANEYENYKEMLSSEKDLDAVIIATPDWMHAEQSIACMKAGLHVYCERPMATNLTDAAKMLATAKATGKLLQIGYHRRSDPRYIAAKEIIGRYRLLGQVKNVNTQHNKCAGWHIKKVPKNEMFLVDESVLNKYGYASMHELINWRLFAKFGIGPFGERASGQIDAIGWLLGDVNPTSVMAVGGRDYFKLDHDENIMGIFEYQGNDGSVRSLHQILNTTIYGAYGRIHEVIMGDEATMILSPFARGNRTNGWILREGHSINKKPAIDNWKRCQDAGLVGGPDAGAHAMNRQSILGVALTDNCQFNYHQLLTEPGSPSIGPHLNNFFDAIGGRAKLNCPGEIAYKTTAAVQKAHEAIKNAEKINFTKDDFKA